MAQQRVAPITIVLSVLLTLPVTAQIPPSVEFRVPKAPAVAAIGDSARSLAYELHITNLTPGALSLMRIEVLNENNGRVLLTLTDSVLLRALVRPGPTVPAAERARINGGLRALAFLWVPLERGTPPSTVRHRLTFERVAPDTGTHVLTGATTAVSPEYPVVGPPLRGEWLAGNGPSNASGHRRTYLGLNGNVTVPQRYGIDYLRVDDKDNTTRSDRSSNENFYAENQEILAVADGMVVDTKDGLPENVPGGRAVAITLETVGGNYIVIDIGQSRFAFYAHIKPGTQRVKLGDRVQRGQVIGLVGNSGNSTEPHLHFHIADALAKGTTTLGAEGLPYGIDRMEVVGSCALATAIGPCTRKAAVILRGAMPAQNQLVRFPSETQPPRPKYGARAGAPYTAEEVTITTPMGHTLSGTLTLPRGASRTRRVPALVSITGSGPQDRDEAIGLEGFQPFEQFADSLGRRGIAVLRMDDRGTGSSKGTFRGATSADFAEDIRAGLAYLRTRPDIDSRRLGLIGHSEGAVIAPMVAIKEPSLRALVLLAGVARPAYEVLVFQITNLINHNEKFTQAQKDSASANIPKQIDGMMAADPWMKFFLTYDPSADARKLKNPAILILTGANDQQANPKQVPDWVAAFKQAGNRNVTGHILPGLNHMFVVDPDGFPGGYAKLPPPVRVDRPVVGMVADWVVQRMK